MDIRLVLNVAFGMAVFVVLFSASMLIIDFIRDKIFG